MAWLIVSGLASLRADLRERPGLLETRIAGLETRMSSMELRMSAMEARMSAMECELGCTQGLLDSLRPAASGSVAAD